MISVNSLNDIEHFGENCTLEQSLLFGNWLKSNLKSKWQSIKSEKQRKKNDFRSTFVAEPVSEHTTKGLNKIGGKWKFSQHSTKRFRYACASRTSDAKKLWIYTNINVRKRETEWKSEIAAFDVMPFHVQITFSIVFDVFSAHAKN